MSIFNDVELRWQGDIIPLPAQNVLPAIAIIESQITFIELVEALSNGKPPLLRIATAYAALLTYAGRRTSAEEVYSAMFGSGNVQAEAVNAINQLMILMVPPAHLMEGSPAQVAAGKRRVATVRPAGRSKRGTKRRSATAG